MTLQNIKISLRTDDLSNWTSSNPVLRSGELAVVNDISAGFTRFKVGNGASAFNQLPFVNQTKVITDLLEAGGVQAQHISQGTHASATPFGLAAGYRLSANANYSQAMGFKSQTSASHDFSFAWNGNDSDYTILGDQYYTSHGRGTFNINPLSGLSGFYIGEQSLASILSSKQDVLIATTQEWRQQSGFVPANGQIVIWSDKDTVLSTWEEGGQSASADVVVPGVKIGNGNAYNLDLPFIGDDIAVHLLEHVQSNVHLSAGEREDWNHKITVGDPSDPTDDGVVNETLIITRD